MLSGSLCRGVARLHWRKRGIHRRRSTPGGRGKRLVGGPDSAHVARGTHRVYPKEEFSFDTTRKPRANWKIAFNRRITQSTRFHRLLGSTTGARCIGPCHAAKKSELPKRWSVHPEEESWSAYWRTIGIARTRRRRSWRSSRTSRPRPSPTAGLTPARPEPHLTADREQDRAHAQAAR